MDYSRIEELLNWYLEGESSLEEEALLKEYFSQAEVLPEHREMQEMFHFFASANQEMASTSDITQDLNELIGQEWKKENRNRFRKVMVWFVSAAAVLVFSIGTLQYLQTPKPQMTDTCKDPKLAYLETRKALLMVSKVMNHNTSKLRYLSKVDKSFAQMRNIAKIDKVVNSVKN